MNAMVQRLQRAADAREQRQLVRRTAVRVGGLDLASNDYLGLARDPRLAAAARAAIERYGTGAGASRVVTGTLPVHEELEAELCALTGQPAALAFSTGYAANIGVLTALGGPGTLLVLDEHVHASLHDGARLSRSPIMSFAHGDVAELRRLLAARTQPRAMVAVESVYSVLGDAADLPKLAAACAEHDAVLVVDEAHGIGVLGEGRGGVAAAGLGGDEQVIVTVTLSKSLGAQGGAVLGRPLLREHLVNTARTFVFDTGLAPAAAAAAAAACRIVATEPERVAALHRNAELLGTRSGADPAAGAVRSVRMPDAEAARLAMEALHRNGILVGCFRPPSVPDGVSRLRLTAHADHDPDELARVAAQITDVVRG